VNQPTQLLARLDAIGQALAQMPIARALIALGSVGPDLDRLDAFSDLDFFVITAPGQQSVLLADLSWLARIVPIAFAFQNTPDGYKLLFDDGIFCEFAIFDEAALAGIPFAPGRIVWRHDTVDPQISQPQLMQPTMSCHTEDWLLGEALTNLYVGLCRDQRGEHLSAVRFIQSYAVDRVVEWVAMTQLVAGGAPDPFSPERRIEQRYPDLAQQLPQFVQGYDRSRESAAAILRFVAAYTVIPPALQERILALCEPQPHG
jgi:hypothetical protein